MTSDERRQNDKTWHIVKEYKQKRDDICQKIQDTKEALQIAKGNLASLREEKKELVDLFKSVLFLDQEDQSWQGMNIDDSMMEFARKSLSMQNLQNRTDEPCLLEIAGTGLTPLLNDI
jgi:RAB protein geranylgeranyltransferase component A